MKPHGHIADPYQKLKDWCDEADKLLESERKTLNRNERAVLQECFDTLEIMYLYVGENKDGYNKNMNEIRNTIKDNIDNIEHKGLLQFLLELERALPNLDNRVEPKAKENRQPARQRSGAVTSGLFKSNEYRLAKVTKDTDEELGIDSKSGKFTDRELDAKPRRYSRYKRSE